MLKKALKSSIIKNFINNCGLCTFGATVPTGLEFLAKEEIKEKIDIGDIELDQGRVYFNSKIDCLPKLHSLRSVERLFLVIKTFNDYEYSESNKNALEDLKKLAHNVAWPEIEEFWEENRKYQKSLFKKKLVPNKSKTDVVADNTDICDKHTHQNSSVEKSSHLIRFRTTANRVGKNQSITSPEAEWHFGGAIQDLTNWEVDLSSYNLEVLLTLGIDFVTVSLSLTHESLHRRNIVNFGYTTLKASIAYGMLRLCEIKPGDVVIDPMCGSGSIPIEAAHEWTDSFHVGGDKSSVALKKSHSNVKHVNSGAAVVKSPIDILQWDITNLPLASNKVDVIVTDVPFGKRLGSKMDNRTLYPSMLKEMARVCRRKFGRVCILTNDKRSMIIALGTVSNLWVLKKNLSVNVGGLRAVVYYLQRTEN